MTLSSDMGSTDSSVFFDVSTTATDPLGHLRIGLDIKYKTLSRSHRVGTHSGAMFDSSTVF